VPRPGAGQVLVHVQARSVNPIDAKGASGYGRRLLTLKGTGRFPLIVGNDVAGVIQKLGTEVTRVQRGQPVFGLVGTGRGGGAHASHVVVSETDLMPAPLGSDLRMLATLHYSFTTMWLAVSSTGLRASNAESKRVLISGASGALGKLTLPLLHGWRCEVTAICDSGRSYEALTARAARAMERGNPGRRTRPRIRCHAELRRMAVRSDAREQARSPCAGLRNHGASADGEHGPTGVDSGCHGQHSRFQVHEVGRAR